MNKGGILEGLDTTFGPEYGHLLLAGASGTGKTRCASSIAFAKMRNPATSLFVIDPEGEIASECYAFLGNPKNHLGWRKVHYLKPASHSHAFALPLLHVPDRNPVECHNRALRTLTVFSQLFAADAGDLGIRMAKLLGLGCLGLALTGRPLVALPELYNSGAAKLREIIASALPYPFLGDAWLALDSLSDRASLEYRDPVISRLQPVYGNPIMRRVFGPQPPLDIGAALRNREVVLLDLSGLEHKDAVLIGKAFFSLVFHEALHREPNRAPHGCVLLDEAFDYISPDMARGFDRLRKRNVQLVVCIQRLAQLAKLGDADSVATLSAVMSGTRSKFWFRLPEPDDAEYAAKSAFTGHISFNTWKEGTERPVVVGHERAIVRSRSRSRQEARHEAESSSESFARGWARSRSRSVTEAEGSSVSQGSSTSTAHGAMQAEAGSASTSLFESAGASQTMAPPPEERWLLPMPEPVLLSVGESTGTGQGLSTSTSWSAGTSLLESSSTSRAVSTSRSTAVSEAVGESQSEMRGVSRGRMRGTSHGESHGTGEGETFVPVLAWLPSQTYSLPEMLHRLAGEIQNLALREVFVKIDNAAPVRTRTATVEQAFASSAFRRLWMPIFHAAAVKRSGFLFPVAEVDTLIASSLANLVPASPLPSVPAEPEPVPIIDAPDIFAREFWDKRRPHKAKGRDMRAPKGLLGPPHQRFRVLDGDKEEGPK
jgi:hypothetical protein